MSTPPLSLKIRGLTVVQVDTSAHNTNAQGETVTHLNAIVFNNGARLTFKTHSNGTLEPVLTYKRKGGK